MNLILKLVRYIRSICDHVMGRAHLDEALVRGAILPVLEGPEEAGHVLLLCFYDHVASNLFLVRDVLFKN